MLKMHRTDNSYQTCYTFASSDNNTCNFVYYKPTKVMDKRLKVIYGSIIALIIAAMIVFPLSYDTFHWIRIGIYVLIASIPFIYWKIGKKPYLVYIALGLTIYALSTHFTIYYGHFIEARIVLTSIVYLLFIRAFTYFKGYTFKTPHLLILLGVVILFYSIVYTRLGSLSALIGMYIGLFVLMCWQGGNLYFIRKTHGYYFILIFVIVDLCNNFIHGVNLFVTDIEFLSLLSQILHWIALSILAYTTTIPRKKFGRLMKSQYRSSRKPPSHLI